MPRVALTHPVKDLDHWLSKHAERVAAFAPWGSNVIDAVGLEAARPWR
jgi:hypothetical protein